MIIINSGKTTDIYSVTDDKKIFYDNRNIFASGFWTGRNKKGVTRFEISFSGTYLTKTHIYEHSELLEQNKNNLSIYYLDNYN